MAGGAMSDRERAPRRYSAFFSYNRKDMRLARRIHRRLEAYRLPKRLQPANDVWNPTSRRLLPLFRDLDEATAAADIRTAVRDAMQASRFLVVLATPRSAQSDWVGHEIDLYRELHGDSGILVALADGTPASAFHPNLLRSRDAGSPLQPLAADFRPGGDGQRLALLKLVAVMAGVGLGDLVQRDAQRRLRQILTGVALATATLLLVAGLAVVALNARLVAERERARGGALSGYMIEDLRKRLQRSGDVAMLGAVNRGVLEFFRGRDLSGLTEAELQQLAALRRAMGDDAEKRGDLDDARRQIDDAARITATLLASRPDDSERLFDHAQSQFYVGMINWRLHNNDRARRAFVSYRDLATRLRATAPDKLEWLMEVGYAESNLGAYVLRTAVDTATADRHFAAALAAFAAADAGGADGAKSSIADTEAWIADSRRIRGDFAAAAAARTRQRRLLTALAEADPNDRTVATDLVANELAMARIASARGDNAAALGTLDRAREGAVAIARADVENVRAAAQVRMIDLWQLRVWLALPPARRPPAARLAALNGDCEDDRVRLKSDELAGFCRILEARRSNRPPPVSKGDGNVLTERWGLDFAAERRLGAVNGGAG